MTIRKYSNPGVARIARPPMRTISELADEFGVSKGQLGACLGHDKMSPTPVFYHANKSNKNTWYDHKEMQKWWQNRIAHK